MQQVDHLQRLAILDPETTLLQRAVIEVLAEMAESLDRLAGDEPRGFGSI